MNIRADFEAWAVQNGYPTDYTPNAECGCEGGPVYADSRTHAAWWAFRAGRGEPQISTAHGPWLPSSYDEGETYCKRCLTRSVFADKRVCDPHIVYPQTA